MTAQGRNFRAAQPQTWTKLNCLWNSLFLGILKRFMAVTLQPSSAEEDSSGRHSATARKYFISNDARGECQEQEERWKAVKK